MISRLQNVLVAALMIAAIGPAVADNPALTGLPPILKGPYLQNPTLDAITICWESSAEAIGTVRYGENSLDEGRQQEEKAVSIHRVRITGLKPSRTIVTMLLRCG